MPTHSSKIIRYLKKKRVIIPLAVLLIIIIAIIARPKGKPSYDTAKVVKADITEQVSVTGKVVAAQDVSLAFEKGGTIANVYVQPGARVTKAQILAELSAGDIKAQYDQALASVNASQARRDETVRGTRTEDLAIESAKYESALVTLHNEQKDYIDALYDVYAKVADAVRNKTDAFFSYPETVSQTFNLQTDPNSSVETNSLRRQAGYKISDFKATLDSATTTGNLTAYGQSAESLLAASTQYMQKLSTVVNSLADEDNKSTVITALAELNTARSSYSAAASALRNAVSAADLAKKQLDLKQAGATTEEVSVAQAQLGESQASLESASAQLEKTRLRSPIDGVVTKAEPKTGEIFAGGKLAFRVISDNAFQMEAYIPEADIAKVKAGDMAKVTLDAYGSDVAFDASVLSIEPAETLVENVPTYKTILVFKDKDERIRSGMTANIDITTNIRPQALNIPYRAVVSNNGKKIVRVLDQAGNMTEKPVLTGLRGINGEIEITSGLQEGEDVVTFIKK